MARHGRRYCKPNTGLRCLDSTTESQEKKRKELADVPKSSGTGRAMMIRHQGSRSLL